MIDLNFSTGVEEIKINGKRSIWANLSDIRFMDTVYGLLGKLDAIKADEDKKKAKTTELDKIFDYSKICDKRMREAVDSVFGEGFCDDVFEGVGFFGLADGLTAIENLVFAITDKMDESVRDNLAKREGRIANYTAKYQKYKK